MEAEVLVPFLRTSMEQALVRAGMIGSVTVRPDMAVVCITPRATAVTVEKPSASNGYLFRLVKEGS